MRIAAILAAGLLGIPAWLRFSFWWWSEMVYEPLITAGMVEFAAGSLVVWVGGTVTVAVPALICAPYVERWMNE